MHPRFIGIGPRPVPALILALCVAMLGVSSPALAAGDGAPPSTAASGQAVVALPSLSPLVKRVLTAVVNVVAEVPPDAEADDGGDAPPDAKGDEDGGTPFDEFLRRYFERRGLPPGTLPAPRQETPNGKMIIEGSAFIIDPAGYIVTNNHVVAKATRVTVIFQDYSRHQATVIGTDPVTDLALLKIATKDSLPALEWGDSDTVAVGDWVMTVGNPFGLGGTVTAGIVSALGRDIQQGPFDDFLQIDAPINRGSSGGPTFDVAGRVVGINTAIYSPSGGNIGIGFAIPSNIAKIIVSQLREAGHVDHGYLGITSQNILPDVARALHLDPNTPQGLLIDDVALGSPAAAAGLRVGDVIRGANGQPVRVTHDVARLVATAKIGDRLSLEVDRNGRTRMIDAVIGRAPAPHQSDRAGGQSDRSRVAVSGIWFAALTPDAARSYQIADSVKGVLVRKIDPGSPASAIGLMPGDVIISIDRQPVHDPAEAASKIRAAQDDKDVLLLVSRHGGNIFTALPTGKAPPPELPEGQ